MRLFFLFPVLALGRDLSPPPDPAPSPHPDYPEDPPPDPRCRACRWGAQLGSAALAGHLQPLGAHAKPAGKVQELPQLPDPATMYKKARVNKPFVVRGGIRAQPAFQSWSDEYMVKEFGETMVDVELVKKEDRFGKSLQSWPLRKFIRKMNEDNASLYVVHDLTPKMRRDWQLLRPLACREISMSKMVLWFSSGGTTSIVHSDPHENLLSLHSGSKRLLLFHQVESAKLYDHAARRGGTSPIDVDAVDMELFPRVAEVKYKEVTLHPGDVLYIPKGYWHQVRSESGKRNLAVNYWWRYPHDNTTAGGEVALARAKLQWPAKAECTALAENVTYDQVPFLEQESDEEAGLNALSEGAEDEDEDDGLSEGGQEDDDEDEDEEEDDGEDL